MHDWDDHSLLREYVEHDSGEAFATLVGRHVNMVYSVALRHVRNPHHAEEITQAVFVILAKKSRRLGQSVVLSGWLYLTARLTAVTFIRSEIRRTRREQEAYMQNTINENSPESWPQVAPHLDNAMASLREADRHAVVLRFFDGRSLRDVGNALGVSEDSAKKRIQRAVGKLRQFLVQRGVTLPVATLTAIISANSVEAAPAGLAKAATAVAAVQGATASSGMLALVNGTLKCMAWLKAKSAIPAGAAATFAAGLAMRELGVRDTLYLCLGLVLCLILPMMLSLRAPVDAAIRRSSLRIVWGGQLLLALAALIVLVSEQLAFPAIVFGSATYLGCVVALHRKLRAQLPPRKE